MFPAAAGVRDAEEGRDRGRGGGCPGVAQCHVPGRVVQRPSSAGAHLREDADQLYPDSPRRPGESGTLGLRSDPRADYLSIPIMPVEEREDGHEGASVGESEMCKVQGDQARAASVHHLREPEAQTKARMIGVMGWLVSRVWICRGISGWRLR